MKPAEVRKQIASGATEPLYLLEGDDLQSRHDLALEFAGVVDEGLQAFNVEYFHGSEAGSAGARDQMIAAILSGARTLPMMAPRRVLIVHEAERLLSPRKAKDEDEGGPPPAPGGKRKRSLTPAEELEEYFAAPEPLSTLVFVAGPLDGNRRLVKLLRKHGVSVSCGSLDSEADAARWIRARLDKDKLAIDQRAIALLLEATGLNLGRVRAETDKVALYAVGESAVTVRHVRDLVTALTEPGEDFALGRAIWNGNAREALREVGAELDSGKPAFMVLGLVRAAAIRLKPDHLVKQSLDSVLETDLAIKSSLGEPRFLLERLVIELCAR